MVATGLRLELATLLSRHGEGRVRWGKEAGQEVWETALVSGECLEQDRPRTLLTEGEMKYT